MGLRGAASGLAWRLAPVSRLRLHRPPGVLPHRPRERYCRAGHAGPQLTSRSNPGTSIPDGAHRFLVAHSCRASLARRRFAAQPVRREPSRRQTGKPAYSCLAKSQKQKPNRLAFPPRQAVDARFRRKSDTVNRRRHGSDGRPIPYVSAPVRRVPRGGGLWYSRWRAASSASSSPARRYSGVS